MTPLKELLQQADQLKTSRHQDITITEDTIKELHRTVLTGGGTTPADSYRTGMSAIDDYGYQPPHPEDVPRLTGHLADQIRSSKSSLSH